MVKVILSHVVKVLIVAQSMAHSQSLVGGGGVRFEGSKMSEIEVATPTLYLESSPFNTLDPLAMVMQTFVFKHISACIGSPGCCYYTGI